MDSGDRPRRTVVKGLFVRGVASRRRGRGALATLKSSPTWFAPTRVLSGETSPNERVGYFPQSGKHGANVRQSDPPPKPRNCSAVETSSAAKRCIAGDYWRVLARDLLYFQLNILLEKMLLLKVVK